MDFRRFPHDTQVNFLKLGQSLTLSLTTTRLARCRSTPMAPRSGTTHSGCPVRPAMPCPTCTYLIKLVLVLSYFEPLPSQLVDRRDGEAGDLLYQQFSQQNSLHQQHRPHHHHHHHQHNAGEPQNRPSPVQGRHHLQRQLVSSYIIIREHLSQELCFGPLTNPGT